MKPTERPLHQYIVLTPQDKEAIARRRIADLEVQHYELTLNVLSLKSENNSQNGATIEEIGKQMATIESHIEAISTTLPKKNEEGEQE